MKTILTINDNSPEAEHAAEFAVFIAQKMQAHILLAHTYSVNSVIVGNNIVVGDASKVTRAAQLGSTLATHLTLLNNKQTDFKSEIKEIDISAMDENQLAGLIHKDQIWMMVKGIADFSSPTSHKRSLNINNVLKKVCCPLLLVPEKWTLKHIERLVYVTDLRYCRLQIVRFLAAVSKPWRTDLSIAHLSAKGLPDMDDKHANDIFDKGVSRNVDYGQLFFNNIKEKDLKTTVDVMINGMNNDLLVLINNTSHFEEIIGRCIGDTLPSHITIPVMIFP